MTQTITRRYYLDTSVAVHALAGTPSARAWFDRATASAMHGLVSSRLLQTELVRVLRREGHPLPEADEILDNLALLPITVAVLTTAESISEHVRTLDAIHVASAVLLGSGTVVVTNDSHLNQMLTAVGLDYLDPIAEG